LDPLGDEPSTPGTPLLTPGFHRIDEDELRNLPAEIIGGVPAQAARNAQEAIEALRSIYCATIGYNYGHVRIPEERAWLFEVAESGRFRPPRQEVDERKL